MSAIALIPIVAPNVNIAAPSPAAAAVPSVSPARLYRAPPAATPPLMAVLIAERIPFSDRAVTSFSPTRAMISATALTENASGMAIVASDPPSTFPSTFLKSTPPIIGVRKLAISHPICPVFRKFLSNMVVTLNIRSSVIAVASSPPSVPMIPANAFDTFHPRIASPTFFARFQMFPTCSVIPSTRSLIHPSNFVTCSNMLL